MFYQLKLTPALVNTYHQLPFDYFMLTESISLLQKHNAISFGLVSLKRVYSTLVVAQCILPSDHRHKTSTQRGKTRITLLKFLFKTPLLNKCPSTVQEATSKEAALR